MGQYFQVVNLDKKEKLHPHAFGDGLKLMEMASGGYGVLAALALLLRQSSEWGGGDFSVGLKYDDNHNLHTINDLLGSWAGDRIAVVGDYDDSHIYEDASYKDISKEVVEMCKMDTYMKERIENSFYTELADA